MMPALKEEYDYFEYAKRRQGTVKNTVPSSGASKKNNIASSNKSAQKLNVKTSTTREITKKATRIATQDDFVGSKKNINRKKDVVKTISKNKLPDDFINNSNKKKTYAKPQEMTLKRPKSNVKAKNIAKQKARVKEMFKNFIIALVLFGMFFLICYRYSSINEAFNEVNDIKSDLKKQQTINAQLESSIQKSTDLAYIENYAKYQLGMQKPKDSQIQKINVKKQDKITTPIEIKEEEEESKITIILNDLLKILD